MAINTFLEEHHELFKDYEFKNGVAVVARINSIKTAYVTGEEGEREEVKTGKWRIT
jgi:hypothetical protein